MMFYVYTYNHPPSTNKSFKHIASLHCYHSDCIVSHHSTLRCSELCLNKYIVIISYFLYQPFNVQIMLYYTCSSDIQVLDMMMNIFFQFFNSIYSTVINSTTANQYIYVVSFSYSLKY